MSHLVSLDHQCPIAEGDDALVASGVAVLAPASPSLALVQTGPGAVRSRSDRGLVSAEWAMAIIAAVAIVGILVSVITTGPVKAALSKVVKAIIEHALTLI